MERNVLFYWLAQIFGWGAYFILSVLLLYSNNELDFTFNLFVYIASSIVVSVLISHSIRYFIVNRNLVSRKLVEIIIWTLVMSLAGAIILEAVQYWLTEDIIEVDFIDQTPAEKNAPFSVANFSFAVFRSILLFLLWTGFYLSFIFIEK